MRCFVDTSGFLALTNSLDEHHRSAADLWQALIERDEPLFTRNYVILETVALLHRRFGVQAVNRFVTDVLPAVTVDWGDVEAHSTGLQAVMLAPRQGPGLVDCVSSEMMDRRRVTAALAFDRHFALRGYILPTH